MKSQSYLLECLGRLFQIGEIFIGAGLVLTVCLFPLATRWVARGDANVAIIVAHDDTLMFTVNTTSFPVEIPGIVSPGPGSGDITFGRFFFFGIRPGESPPLITQETGMNFHSLDGLVTLKRPANATAILEAVKWPLLLSIVCRGVVGIACLELLRRLFKSVRRRDTFTGASIRYVQLLAVFVIADDLVRIFLVGWLQSAIVPILTQHASSGTIRFAPWGLYSGGQFVTGLVILALAEVFRQGLVLKEENTLTI